MKDKKENAKLNSLSFAEDIEGEKHPLEELQNMVDTILPPQEKKN